MTIKTYLGFDVGTKRTGVAIANSLTAHANGIDTVIHNKDGSTNWKGLECLISQHDPDGFIVGLPLDKDNQEQEMTFIAKSFQSRARNDFHRKIIWKKTGGAF